MAYLMWYYVSSACADPGISNQVGVESPGPSDSKKLGQSCFVTFAVFSPHLQLI